MSNEQDEVLKYLGPATYKDKALSLDSQRKVFVIYFLMNLRNGDFVPDSARIKAIAEEHGIDKMNLEDLVNYERWLRLEPPAEEICL